MKASRSGIYFFALTLATVALVPFYRADAARINATNLLGQLDGSDNPIYTQNLANNGTTTVNAKGFLHVGSLALDTVNHRLFVSDTYNNRILVFDLDSTNSIASHTATHVLGACTFTAAGAGGATQNTFDNGSSVNNITFDAANERLFVSDWAHNRVLGFDVDPARITDCENASFVLGQTTFTGAGTGVTQSTLHGPDDIVFDGVNSRLFVSDQMNSRLLAYSVPAGADSSINGENALFALGQADFTHSTGTTTQNGLKFPAGIAYDSANSRVFTADYSNNRVVAYSVPAGADSSINGENALFVLGQSDFTHSTGGTSQTAMNAPDDMVYDTVGNRLFLTDGGHRILIYQIPSNATTSINNQPALNNLGQTTWSSSTSGLSQSVLTSPESPASYDPVNNKMYVYEGNPHRRPLEFDFIHITNASLASGTVGSAYSQSILTEHALGTSTVFSIYSGSLPDGLSLSTTTGLISGTPTAPTTTSVSIEADDSSATGPFFDVKAFSIAVQDVNPPAVLYNGPSGTVSGTITLTASSTDDVGVANMSFYEGSTLIASQTTANAGPDTYSAPWDTSSVSDGSYTLYAVAQDASGNTATSSVEVKVSNHPGGNGAIVGSGIFAPGYVNSGSVAVPSLHVVMLSEPPSAGSAAQGVASVLTVGSATSSAALLINSNYQLWDTGAEVRRLQQWLNQNGYVITTAGDGSPGNEIDIFGPLTYQALVKFQAAHGIPATGFLGPLTRAALAQF